MSEHVLPVKPLGIKAYGSIPHLPGSRRGPGDRGLSEDQARIATERARDRHDVVIVQEKLDGSCVSVAKIEGKIVPLIRAGYRATASPREQHRLFHDWAMARESVFARLLDEGERVVGEWLALAHGTRYALVHEPFVAFDLMRDHFRAPWSVTKGKCESVGLVTPRLISIGAPMSVADAVAGLGEFGHHGALDSVEGAVWRVERKGVVDFLGKFVRPGKVDGCYLIEKFGKDVWNWRPEKG